MKQIWLRAETKQNERRTPIIPVHAGILVKNGHNVFVEKSANRIFKDSDYKNEGCSIVEYNSWRESPTDAYIIGLKELPQDNFPLRRRHLYFAHAYEHQAGADELLLRYMNGGGFLFDFEHITDTMGSQLVTGGAGYWAGVCAVAATLDIWLQKQSGVTPPYKIPTHFDEYDSLVNYIKIKWDNKQCKQPKILILGQNGYVGRGVRLLLDELKVTYSTAPRITRDNLSYCEQMLDFDIIFNCIKLNKETPVFLTNSMLKQNRQLSILADVSCEPLHPNNPFPIYSDVTTFANPTHRIENNIDIMSIDNITTMLPRECSYILSEQIFPYLCYFLMAGDNFKASPFERVVKAFNNACQEVKVV